MMTGPGFIQFFPTLRCNRRCGFCFNKGISYMPDTPLPAVETLVKNLAGNGISEIDILGGEPVLYPGLGRLIGAAAENSVHVFLSSNGSDPAALDRLTDRFGGALTVGISLNDEKTPSALDEFIIRRQPLLKSVCRRGMRISHRVERYLASGLQFFLLFMDALSDDALKECLAFYEYMEILDRLRGDHPQAGGVYCSGFIPCEDEPVSAMRCPAGSTKLSVLPDGAVYPCYLMFGRGEFRLGNIFEDALCAIWENPVLDFFRKFGGNNCSRRECAFFRKCRGGCPAVSLSVMGHLDVPDPRCSRQVSHLVNA
ncbi:MAG TPA: radical SAM/SPASM domain-containing protein [Thermodesulfovibrionales bacterium]|nr:radical SAM/SPASM domain-containing protein [Thermodesulfovibrionales bacterium]